MAKRYKIIKGYSYKKYFKLTEESPLRKIKKLLKKLTQKEQKEKTKKKPEKEGLPISLYLKIGALTTFLIIVIFLILSTILPYSIEEPKVWKGSISWEGLNFGDIFTKENALLISIKPELETPNSTKNIYITNKPLLSRAYIIFEPNYNIGNPKELKENIQIELEKIGIKTETTSIENIDKIKNAWIIIVTGKPPVGFAEKIKKISENNVNLIYVGDIPYYEIDENNIIWDKRNIYKELGLYFNTKERKVKEHFNLEKLIFLPSGAKFIKDSIPYIEIGKSTLIFLANYPDTGWENYQQIARDIIKLIDNNPNIIELSYSTQNNTILTVQTGKEINAMLKIKNRKNETTQIKFLTYTFRDNYIYFHQKPIFPPLTNQHKPISIQVKIEDIIEKTDQLSLLTPTQTLKIGTIQKGIEFVSSQNLFIDKLGINKLKLLGENGGLYSKSAVITTQIKPIVTADFEKNLLYIKFEVNGAPQKVNKVNVEIKDKTITMENVKNVTIDLLSLLGDVPVGKYEIKITIDNQTTTHIIEKRPKTGIGRLLSFQNILILILSAIIYVAGLIFRKKEENIYTIVIPEKIPSNIKSINKVKAKQLLDIFDKINNMFKWNYTPLTPKEISEGIKNGLLGKPLTVSIYNIETLLKKMERLGYIKRYENLYMPTEWIKKTKSNEVKLALLRKIKEIAIKNILPFKQPKLNKSYDIALKLVGMYTYLFIYTEREDINKILKESPKYSKKGMVLIITPNENKKKELFNLLKNPQTPFKTLELLIQTKKVLVLTIQELEDRIKNIMG